MMKSDISAGVSFFYYEDLPSAVRWYRDVLGLTAVMEDDWVAIFSLVPGAYLGLVNATDGSQKPLDGDNKGALVALETSDLESWYRTMQAQGDIDVIHGIRVASKGLTEMFQIRDPGGYIVEFFRWRDTSPLRDKEAAT
jgi:catechol 2,3-dioxygenase-like lactoylglutathione lyase family enzyme